jgi:hypothetical protein
VEWAGMAEAVPLSETDRTSHEALLTMNAEWGTRRYYCIDGVRYAVQP